MIRDTSMQDTVLTASPAQRYKRFALWGAAALVLLFVAIALFGGWHASARSVSAQRLRIAEVTQGTLVRDAAVNGKIVAATSPTLYSSAAGTVSLKVKAGDTVKKGQVLAEVDSPELRDQLKKEQSSYEQLQAEVARQQILAKKQKLLAQRDADQAEIDRVAADRTYQRYEHAGELGVINKIDFAKAKDALQSAEVRSKHAAQAAALEGEDVALELKTKQSQLEQQRLTLANAQRKVDELQVRAPMDGFIGSLAVTDRTVVPINSALLTLVDLSVLEVELEVPETFASDLGLGMNVEISVGDTKAMGKLSALPPEVVKNEVLARVRFDGKQPEGLRQNQRVSARLLMEEKPNVLMLPRGTFVDNEGGRFSYLVQDGESHRTPIREVSTSESSVEIL
jgi:HlyD family secretion protein